MIHYRPEIDGLRAIAVLPVVLFHAGIPLFGGGYVGVDVFFVISGYLITSILFRELSEGIFSISGFYERRARRILPALSVTIFAAFVLAWLFLSPSKIGQFGDGLIGISTFSSNYTFLLQQGYFLESTDANPLIHTWSLSVEEQFYLLFPW